MSWTSRSSKVVEDGLVFSLREPNKMLASVLHNTALWINGGFEITLRKQLLYCQFRIWTPANNTYLVRSLHDRTCLRYA
jgi:hypothetical protein